MPNLIHLFTFHYASSISSDLSGQVNSVFLALLYKANQLFYPETFKVSNTELSSLSGIPIKTLPKIRNRLTAYNYNGYPLVSYKSGTTHQAGSYTINYTLTSHSEQTDTKKPDQVPSYTPITPCLGPDYPLCEDIPILTIQEKTTTTTSEPSQDNDRNIKENNLAEVVVGWFREYGIEDTVPLLKAYPLEYLSYALECFGFDSYPNAGKIYKVIKREGKFAEWADKVQYNESTMEITIEHSREKVHWYCDYPPTEGGK